MQCPLCGNEKFRITDTRQFGNTIVRLRRCKKTSKNKGCGKVIRTVEVVETVHVFNPQTISEEYVSLKEYKEKHLDRELEGGSGFQPKIFNF